MNTGMQPQLHLDVYVDLICPWCLIGKRNLTAALASFQEEAPDVAVHLQWHSVQLLPHLPDSGVDFTAFYIDRLGSAEAVRARQAQVHAAAATAEARIEFSRIRRMPNTRKAHQVLAFVAAGNDPSRTEVMVESLLAAHFSRGQNLSDMNTLRDLVADQNLDLAALDAWIAANKGLPEPVEIPGVPFFVVNRQQALSGAQAPDVLLTAMRQSLIQTCTA